MTDLHPKFITTLRTDEALVSLVKHDMSFKAGDSGELLTALRAYSYREKINPGLYQQIWNYNELYIIIHHSTCHSFFQPLSAHGWTSTFLLDIHRLCGALRGY